MKKTEPPEEKHPRNYCEVQKKTMDCFSVEGEGDWYCEGCGECVKKAISENTLHANDVRL